MSVEMTGEQFASIQRLKVKLGRSFSHILYRYERKDFSFDTDIINKMTEEQIAAAFYFPETVEFKTEYIEIDNVQAAASFAKREEVEIYKTFLSGDSRWERIDNSYHIEVFTQTDRKFRKVLS